MSDNELKEQPGSSRAVLPRVSRRE